MAAPPAGKQKRPVWQEVEEHEAKKLSSRARGARQRQRQTRRLAVVYDIEPPHIRLGIAWFLLVMVAMPFGTYALATVYALTAAMAAYQCARCWRRRKPNVPDPFVAAIIAAALPLAAAVSTGAIGLALLGGVALAVLRAGAEGGKAPLIATAARTLQCSLWVGGAAAGMVAAYRFESWAAFGLVLVVSAYETGDYIVGSGARSVFEGPVAGVVAVVVVQFAVAAVGFPPFDIGNSLGFAALAAVLCPMGQLLASLVLPAAAAPAPAVRRLDSLLLLGPVWALVAGAVASTQV